MSVKGQHVKARESAGISQFSSSTMWILESKLGISGLAVDPSIHYHYVLWQF